jgi:hypothetical protein
MHPKWNMSPPTGEEDEEEEGKVEEDKQSEAPPGGEVHVEPVAFQEEAGAILEANDQDVISGRGAAVNLNPGNRRFRDLCFKRKPEFDAASHAAKRRIANEIVVATKETGGRFLKRKVDKGPWFEMDDEKALLKACQVMRDYQRPDRIALRQASGNGRKRQRLGELSTEPAAPTAPAEPLAPIVENPYGVHDHDVLSGRGAFVNGHVGNANFRKLCLERKQAFDAGNYSEKRALATEVVQLTKALDPPGRFLKRAPQNHSMENTETITETGEVVDGEWIELSDDKAIHKACQVMRDIARPDRINGRGRRKGGKAVKTEDREKDSMTILAETTAGVAVEEALVETEQSLEAALVSTGGKSKDEMQQPTAEHVEI